MFERGDHHPVEGKDGDQRVHGERDDAQNATDIAALRESEIQRLLTDNARLNERVMFLLKVIEREQPRNRTEAAAEVSGDAILHDVKVTLEAELRPVLDVLLRLLEKLQAFPVRREPHTDGGIIDLDAPRANE